MPLDDDSTIETYSAFCRQYGDYCTPAVGEHNWNKEAMQAMVTDLTEPWDNLRSRLRNLNECTTRSIQNLMNTEFQELGKSWEYLTLFLERLLARCKILCPHSMLIMV